MSKYAILTAFHNFDPAYSLCNIVQEQIEMFQEHNKDITLIGLEGLKWPNDVSMRYLPITRFHWTDLEDFEKKANVLYQTMEKIMPILFKRETLFCKS